MLKHGPALDYFGLIGESRKIDPAKCRTRLKVAVLGDFSTQHLVTLLKTLFWKSSVAAEIYEAEFDTTDLEIANPESALFASEPQQVVLLNSVLALRQKFYETKDRAGFAPETVASVVRRWDAVHAVRPTATVIQTNYVAPVERFFGHFDLKVPGSLYATVLEINAALAAAAREREYVRILDVDGLASLHGRADWLNEKLWTLYKSFCALECLPYVAKGVVDVAMTYLGAGIKCVVLDLDNTLWGGVIGDDGLDGIKVGHLDEGEAYTNFQHFLLELKRRGVLLAVCSKNDPENAVLPFRKHPDMVLRENDFAAFVANWNNKADNLKAIQGILNVGFDSMLFVDDDPFERNLVRELVPGVTVPEMPADPADFVAALSEPNYFETSQFSGEDTERTELYRAEAERRLAEKTFESPESFLRSLRMRATLARFDEHHLPRVAQLIQRSNQFNLCTRRFSEAECAALMKDERYFPFYVKVADRFSDVGLISAVVLSFAERDARIEEWVMSCRVLLRGVEQHAMNFTVDVARKKGARRLFGRFVPTAKNKMVRDFFAQFGFTKLSETPDGASEWSLDVEAYVPKPVYFEENGT